MPNKTMAVFPESLEWTSRAQTIADTLQLPLTHQLHAFDYFIVVGAHGIGIRTQTHTHPLYIDFLSSESQKRSQRATLKREPLAKAMGLKNNEKPNILDATGGLLRDSFVLASLGFPITVLERSPLVLLLIQDAWERANKDPATSLILSRITLLHEDAIPFLSDLEKEKAPDIIYLDPMFPERKKSALSKKDMQIFQALIGEDLDSDALLSASLTCAKKRVVVKRPRLAKPLLNLAPSFTQLGQSSRFDIYLTQGISWKRSTA